MGYRAGGEVTSSGRAAAPRRPDHASRRVLQVAFGISALLHLIAIALYPVLFEGLRPEGVTFPVTSSSDPLSGLEVIRLVEIDEAEEALEVQADRQDGPPPVRVTPGPGQLFDPSALDTPIRPEFAPPPPTAAERLRPRLTDARIWAPLDRTLGELTPARREQLLASGRLQEWYDSVLVAEDQLRRLTDWTFTDGDGKRWGVSDGRMYLGDFSLPLPFDFGVAPGNREEVNQRMYQFEEITRQGRQMEIRDTWRQRSEAIRARRDRERAVADSVRGPG